MVFVTHTQQSQTPENLKHQNWSACQDLPTEAESSRAHVVFVAVGRQLERKAFQVIVAQLGAEIVGGQFGTTLRTNPYKGAPLRPEGLVEVRPLLSAGAGIRPQ